MLIWMKVGCMMTCSICCWTWSFFDSKAGVLCGIVSRKMWGMMEWLDMTKISAYVLVLSWNEKAQNIKKIWEWTPNKAPESFTNQTMSFELLPHSPHFPSHFSACSKIVTFFLQSFVFRIESLYQTTSTAACGILAHQATECWKEKGLYLNLVFVVVHVLWETVFWNSSSFMNSHIMLLGKLTSTSLDVF